jgi:hypothetical protein
MATLTYTFVSRCAGGGHTALDVSLNGGNTRRIVYTTDEVRAPLSELTQEERETLALLILKVHLAGRTRQQIVNEFNAGPITVTV